MFYRVKCVFQEIAKTLRFYRVNRASGVQKGPTMDPKMGPETPRTRVLPGFSAIDMHKTPCFTVYNGSRIDLSDHVEKDDFLTFPEAHCTR